MKDLVLKLIGEIANQQVKLENLREKDSVTQTIDLSNRNPPKAGNINVIQYAQINYGSILSIAVEMLEMADALDSSNRMREIKVEKPQVQIEYKKEELTLDELAEDICRIMFNNKVNFNDFLLSMKRYYFEHLMDRFNNTNDIARYLSMNPGSIYQMKKRLEKNNIPQIKEMEGQKDE